MTATRRENGLTITQTFLDYFFVCSQESGLIKAFPALKVFTSFTLSFDNV